MGSERGRQLTDGGRDDAASLPPRYVPQEHQREACEASHAQPPADGVPRHVDLRPVVRGPRPEADALEEKWPGGRVGGVRVLIRDFGVLLQHEPLELDKLAPEREGDPGLLLRSGAASRVCGRDNVRQMEEGREDK